MNRRKMLPGRAHSTLSVSAVDYYMPVSGPPSPTSVSSTVTLTPGRLRNIDQDMEALRASRQDNPFIQQVIASRESLIDNSLDGEESDHVNLMSQELSIDDLDDVDPLTLPQMHEHMIRSPPPTTWPRSSNFKVFQFPNNNNNNNGGGNADDNEEETFQQQVEVNHPVTKEKNKPNSKHTSWDGSPPLLKSNHRNHHHYHHQQDRFSSLLNPTNSLHHHRSTAEDSIRLMTDD